ncbi:hypothetical protein T12_4800 [Trichinella patagoniensis]|uniref:Uncharacterized protein n=1 Tax=Trichinella patagoniensis TaxID=990121 RepID=A0A0V1A967_9BILA|nr:hypothetical protein T12_4800 [Trichinella patagoniensis]
MKKAVLKKSFPDIYDKEAYAILHEQRQVQEMLHQFTTAKLVEEDYINEDREACQGKILGIMEATKMLFIVVVAIVIE